MLCTIDPRWDPSPMKLDPSICSRDSLLYTEYQQRRLRHMKKMVPGGDGNSEWCQYLRQFSDQQRSHSVVIQKFFFLLDFIDFMWNQLLPNSSLKCWAYKIVKSDNSISQSHKLISQKLLVTENFLHFRTVWQRSSVLDCYPSIKRNRRRTKRTI